MSLPLQKPAAFDPSILKGLLGLQWKARYVMEGFLSGLHASPFHGLSVEFRDYRDYQPGDDLRHVDWRLYARNDRLCIKRHEQETNARCYLLCDTSASMSYRGGRAWASKMECARVLCAALGWVLLRQNDGVGLLALDDETQSGLRFIPPSQAPLQLGVLLRELEALEPGGGPALANLLSRASEVLHKRSLLVLFSDLLEPPDALEKAFKQLRFLGHECVCLQVLDADEMDFPFSGDTVFEDLESDLRRRVEGSQFRKTYIARFQRFMQSYEELFARIEVEHGLIRTDEDPSRGLARILSARRRKR